MDGGEGNGMILTEELDCRSQNSSPVRRRAQQRSGRVRGALNRSCSVPDSNNPPSLPAVPHGDISTPVSNLTQIGADEHLDCNSLWSSTLKRLSRGKSCDSYEHNSLEDCVNSIVDSQKSQGKQDAAESLRIEETKIQMCHESEAEDCAQGSTQESASSCTSSHDSEVEHDSSRDQSSLNHKLYIPNNHMTKSMQCLNEESQDEVSPCWSSILTVEFVEACSYITHFLPVVFRSIGELSE